MKKYLILLLCINIIGYAVVFSQKKQDTTTIKLYQNLRLENLIEKYIRINEKESNIPGYRIQLSFSSNQTQENEKRMAFMKQYSNIPAYLLWSAPYYKVVIGDFRTRLEAQKVLDHILENYPSAFIIQDMINFPEINNSKPNE